MHMRLLKAYGRIFVPTLLGLLTAGAARAQSLRDASGLTATAETAGLLTGTQEPAVIIGNIVGALIGLLGIVFVVLLIYGGFIWMTAQGSEEKIKKAKGIISSAVIGLVVVFTSYAIAQAVIGALTSATTTAPPTPPSS